MNINIINININKLKENLEKTNNDIEKYTLILNKLEQKQTETFNNRTKNSKSIRSKTTETFN